MVKLSGLSRKALWWCLAAMLTAACHGNKSNAPMIPLDDFEELAFELHMANGFYSAKGKGVVYWQDTIPYNTFLIGKYGYTTTQFDSTLNYLCARPKKFEKVYARINKRLTRLEQAYLNEPDPPEYFYKKDHVAMASADSLHGSIFLDFKLRDTGYYRIEADILLHPQDQSIDPRMVFWFVMEDSLKNTYREYLTPASGYRLRPNGRLTHYSAEKKLHQPATLQGFFVGHQHNTLQDKDTTWYKAVEVYNAALVFQRDTIRNSD